MDHFKQHSSLLFRLRFTTVHALETDGCLPTTSYSISTRQSRSFLLTSTGLLCHCALEHSTKSKAVMLTDKQSCKACQSSDPPRVMSGSTVIGLPNQKIRIRHNTQKWLCLGIRGRSEIIHILHGYWKTTQMKRRTPVEPQIY